MVRARTSYAGEGARQPRLQRRRTRLKCCLAELKPILTRTTPPTGFSTLGGYGGATPAALLPTLGVDECESTLWGKSALAAPRVNQSNGGYSSSSAAAPLTLRKGGLCQRMQLARTAVRRRRPRAVEPPKTQAGGAHLQSERQPRLQQAAKSERLDRARTSYASEGALAQIGRSFWTFEGYYVRARKKDQRQPQALAVISPML